MKLNLKLMLKIFTAIVLYALFIIAMVLEPVFFVSLFITCSVYLYRTKLRDLVLWS